MFNGGYSICARSESNATPTIRYILPGFLQVICSSIVNITIKNNRKISEYKTSIQ
jgi:hypothetical protein